MSIIGIIGAMDEEVAILKELMQLQREERKASMDFYIGKYAGKDVVVVRSGIGKVNAAICAQILISDFEVNAIINTGVAGAIHGDLEIGDIVVSDDVIQHDFDVTGFGGFKLGQIPRMKDYIFTADKALIEKAMNAGQKESNRHRVYQGRILSGDVFVASPEKKEFLWKELHGYCTEMEGAAVGHACYLSNIPFVIIRAMSDKADGTAHTNFNDFVHEAAKRSAEMVLDILTEI